MRRKVTLTGVVVLMSTVFVFANFFDDFDSYSDGNLAEVSNGTWVKVSGNYDLKVKTVGTSKVASQYPVYGGNFMHYAPNSNEGLGADYIIDVDIDIDENSYGGLKDDGRWGVIGRYQNSDGYVYGYIYADVPIGANDTDTATLWIMCNAGSYFWVSGVTVGYLETHSAHIKMTLNGENIRIDANWGDYTKQVNFTVSGTLLNPGPAGIDAKDYHGNYYYVMGNFDNFSVTPEPATIGLILSGFAGLTLRKR